MPDLMTPTFEFLGKPPQTEGPIPDGFCKERLASDRDCPGFNLAGHACACGFAAASFRYLHYHLEGIQDKCSQIDAQFEGLQHAQNIPESHRVMLREVGEAARRLCERIKKTRSLLKKERQFLRLSDPSVWPKFAPVLSQVDDSLEPLREIAARMSRCAARTLQDEWVRTKNAYARACQPIPALMADLADMVGDIQDHFWDVEERLAPENFTEAKNGALLYPCLGKVVTRVAQDSHFWDSGRFVEGTDKDGRPGKGGRKK